MPGSQCAGDEETDLLAELHSEDLQRVWEQAMPPCMLPSMREDLGIPGPEQFGDTEAGAVVLGAPAAGQAPQDGPA